MATRDDVARAITALRAAFPKQTITGRQFDEMVSVWSEILEDIAGEPLMMAVKAWISGDTPWLPSVGQLRRMALEMVPGGAGAKTAGEAWEEVRLALSRGEHGYRKGHYAWSSALVERAFNCVGGWQYFNTALMDSVMADRAHFMRAYGELVERDERERREPPAVTAYRRMLLGGGAAEEGVRRPRRIGVEVGEEERRG